MTAEKFIQKVNALSEEEPGGLVAHLMNKKYVILNGKPHNGYFDCFFIDTRGRLNEYNNISRKQLEGYMYYTKSELDAFKGNMPQRMQNAVDVLTVSLEEALKMEEDNDN